LKLILNIYPIYFMNVVIAEISHPQYLSIYRVPGGRRALRILLPPGVLPPATLLGPPVPMLKAPPPPPLEAAPPIAVGVAPKPTFAPNPGLGVVAAGAKPGVGFGAGAAFPKPNVVPGVVGAAATAVGGCDAPPKPNPPAAGVDAAPKPAEGAAGVEEPPKPNAPDVVGAAAG